MDNDHGPSYSLFVGAGCRGDEEDGMVSRFIPDSIKYGGLVAKAASDDEMPTAGYLQEELKKLTFDPDGCTGVEDALIARLEKRSANVKLKTLRLMKLLCESGAPAFRRDMQRRVKEVRDCLHWQGPPHPTMGDLPNKMVREAAQQVRHPPRARLGAAAPGAHSEAFRVSFSDSRCGRVAAPQRLGAVARPARLSFAASELLLLLPQVINIVFDAAAPAPAPASGLGLMSPSGAAAPPPHSSPAAQPPVFQHSAPAGSAQQPMPLPSPPQHKPSSAQPSTTSKYEGFGSDQFSGRGSDPAHKPLSSYFSNVPAPAPSQAAGPGTSAASTAALGAAATSGNAFALMSDGIMSLSNKLSRVGVRDKPVASAPTPGGGSYTGPDIPGVPRVSAEADRVGVPASMLSGTGYDRYARHLCLCLCLLSVSVCVCLCACVSVYTHTHTHTHTRQVW